MPSSSWSLQRAIYEVLVADAAMLDLLGGPRIFDAVPDNSAFPYLTLGQSSVNDWSSGSEAGEEHRLTLHVWSRAVGRRETHELMAALRGVLHDRALDLDGHRLVNLRHELSEARREADGVTYHGIVRFRAVTEPL
jgi:hypothetical protein